MPLHTARACLHGFTAAVILVAATPSRAQQPASRAPAIVPQPARMVVGTGTWRLTAGTVITADTNDRATADAAEFAAGLLGRLTGRAIPVAASAVGPQAIRLEREDDATLGREGYRLAVASDGVVVRGSPAGIFYGIQSLAQMVAQELDGTEATLPTVDITDAPRFPYRGMHLDVGRHLFPAAFIKRYIDLLAAFKMNTFHWHLTEDQGWRIEITRYPRLTQVGAWRDETILEKNFDPYVGDGERYGGFYTQDEIREIVAYAADRHVTIIPEIELPGHSLAALAAYPEYACTAGPFAVGTMWGVYEDIYCPTEATFEFLQNVLLEVMDLFPGTYIHIGGDEAPKARWETSAAAQDVIRREGLTDEHELQSYFIRRIERFLNDHGRRLIGWDEILEGGLAPEATVMSWRGMAGGIAAAQEGHDVIMTPTSHVYFDYYQGDPEHEPLAIGGFTPLETVYAFEPIPDELTAEQAHHVIGAQGNVWTEYMQTADHVEYMVFPRLLALAEVVWSPRERRSWSGFTNRLGSALRYLDRFGVNYRLPDVTGLERDGLTLDATVSVELGTPIAGAMIHYTLDGSEPTTTSPRYTGPIELPVTAQGTFVTARAVLADGRMSAPRAARYRRARLRAPVALTPERTAPGVTYRYFEERVRSVADLEAATPVTRGVTDAVGLLGIERTEHFGIVFDGLVHVEMSGIYEFILRSDDGSRLWIGSELVVDHDGLHGTSERSGMVALERGYHPIRVAYFQAGGGASLEVRVRRASDGDGGVAPRLSRRLP